MSDKTVLKDLLLSIEPGTIHAIMGPNGSGKSSLAYAIMGHPNYAITAGTLLFEGVDIGQMTPDARAKQGLFLAFQHPCEIPGVSVFSFLKEAYAAVTGLVVSVAEFNLLLQERMEQLGIDASFASRGLNEGFSGGEKKRLELLQLLILRPKIAILDEIDSGLDIDALKVVAAGIALARTENPLMSIVLITHYQRILRYITPHFIHVLCDGHIVSSGDASVADRLESEGYDAFKNVSQQI